MGRHVLGMGHLGLCAVMLSCGLSGATLGETSMARVFPGKHWDTRRPAELGLDGKTLELLGEDLGGRGCVIRHGYVAAAWGDQSVESDWLSSAKPVLSTLLFFAIQEGRVKSVDEPIADFGWELLPKDETMTFRHLANMISGYARPEPPGAAFAYNDYAIQLYQKTLFERVFCEDAGTVANASARLGALGLEDGLDFMPGTNRLVASVRDFARISWFWLNRGEWNGKQLLPRRFFDEYMRPQVPKDLPHTTPAPTHDYLHIGTFGGGSDHFTRFGPGVYGFNWWFNDTGGLHPDAIMWPDAPRDAFMSIGAGGNCSVMIPSLDLVLVSAQGNWGVLQAGQRECLFNQYIQRLAGSVKDRCPSPRTTGQAMPSQESSTLETPRWQPHDFAFPGPRDSANPFLVPLAATVTGPAGRAFKTLGFYDGDGLWKVRVSPDAEGEWTIVTESSAGELDGRTARFRCIPNHNSRIHGRLRIDEEHPRHFIWEDGTRYFLMGYECDWLWALDMGEPESRKLAPFLDKLERYGFNQILVNIYAHDTIWRPGRTCPEDYGPPPMYPWEGTHGKLDHARFNLDFWAHYDCMMQAMMERGIVAHIMLRVYNKYVNWPANRSPEDDLYFRWVVARYAAFPNVVWDFSKEAFNEKDTGYKRERLSELRNEDPYGHLITSHDDDQYGDPDYDALLDFRCDQQHDDWHATLLRQRAQRKWPVVNVEFGYEQGPGGPGDCTYSIVCSPEEMTRRVLEICTAGGYPAYYYTYTAWDILRPEDTPAGYAYMRNVQDFFARTRYWNMVPADERVSTGRCLAAPGEEYVVFLAEPHGFDLKIDQGAGPDGFHSEWFDPLTAKTVQGPRVVSGAHHIVPPEGLGPLVLLRVFK